MNWWRNRVHKRFSLKPNKSISDQQTAAGERQTSGIPSSLVPPGAPKSKKTLLAFFAVRLSAQYPPEVSPVGQWVLVVQETLDNLDHPEENENIKKIQKCRYDGGAKLV